MGLRGCGTTLVVMANECVQPAAENLQLFQMIRRILGYESALCIESFVVVSNRGEGVPSVLVEKFRLPLGAVAKLVSPPELVLLL